MRMHTIPQNVSAYQDKIVGALIGKQFVYIAVAGIISLVVFTSNIGPSFIRAFVVLCLILFSVALAFLRLNERPFDELFIGYCRALFGPSEWSWGKEGDIPAYLQKVVLSPDVTLATTSVKQENPMVTKNRQIKHFQRIHQDQRSNLLDDQELRYIEQLDFGTAVPDKLLVTTPESSQDDAPPMLTPKNYQQHRQTTSTTVTPKINFSSQNPTTSLAGAGSQRRTYIAADNSVAITKKPLTPTPNRTLSRQSLLTPSNRLPIKGEPSLKISQQTTEQLNQILSYQASQPLAQFNQSNQQPSATPQAHVISNSQPMNSFSDDPQQNNPTPDQPQEYELPFGDMRQENQSPPATPEATISPDSPDPVSYTTEHPQMPTYNNNKIDHSVAQEIDSALESLNMQADQLNHTEQPPANPNLASTIPNSNFNPQPTPTPDQAPPQSPNQPHQHHQFRPVPVSPVLPENLQQAQPQPAPPTPAPTPTPPPAPAAPADPNLGYKVVDAAKSIAVKQINLTNEPNIINGRVVDAQGQFVPGVVIVVKDDQGEAKRALKTNKLGQFVVTTPLNNGVYTVEVNKKGFQFDVVQVELTGKILPTIEINAK